MTIHEGRSKNIGHLYRDYNKASVEEYYSDLNQHMANRLEDDVLRAVGGPDETTLQLDIVRSFGLVPSNSLLDFGCGVLRAGRYFIDYLESSKYTGIDISPEALSVAKDFVKGNNKNPKLFLNNSENLIPTDEKYDFIICFWVTYDMPPSVFEQFLNEAIDHMHQDSILIFSYPKKKESRIADGKVFTWIHDYRIVDRVVAERGVHYEETKNFFNDDMTVAFMERD